ncbi:PilZ domain-containing protein [Aquifex sp.]
MAQSPLKNLKKGERYEIYTKVKEIPVKTVLKLSWLDEVSGLVGFDWGNCIRRGAFQPGNVAYLKLSEERFIKSAIVSNKGELILEPQEEGGKPEFLNRRAVRVEVDPANPVIVNLKLGQKEFKTQAKDISEYGVGVIFRKDSPEGQEVLELLEGYKDEWVELELELPKYGKIHAKGKVRRKEVHDKEVYIRFGLELEFSEEDRAKVRKYILERQQEIIKSLRLL